MDRRFEFRGVKTEEELEATEIEQICFPPHEACSREHMHERFQMAPELFLVAVDRKTGRLAGFLNGLATREKVFRDEFFKNASLHDPEGDNVMLLGLAVLPEYREQGIAGTLISEYCRRERAKGRRRLVLTCLEEKVGMYEFFGFRDLGLSSSSWGGEAWHEMDRIL